MYRASAKRAGRQGKAQKLIAIAEISPLLRMQLQVTGASIAAEPNCDKAADLFALLGSFLPHPQNLKQNKFSQQSSSGASLPASSFLPAASHFRRFS
jgi:hypothetical protein